MSNCPKGPSEGRNARLWVACNLATRIRKYSTNTTSTKFKLASGGQYSVFAGMDISRAMATMTMTTKESFDDLSDLTEEQKKNLKTWEATFMGIHVSVYYIDNVYNIRA